MSMNAAQTIAKAIVGKQIEAITFDEVGVWYFTFSGAHRLNVQCPWRIISENRIVLGSCDHAQKFGLPAPLDGVAESSRLLKGKAVQSVRTREDVGDINLEFDDGTVFEVLNPSSGYEGWSLSGKSGMLVVAMGGGELAV
jgi:hypothetical protein